MSGHVVVAPDKFKGSLTAAQVAGHVAAGLRRAAPDLDVQVAPIADGGDGTLEAVATRGYSLVPVVVNGPTGQPVKAAFGRARWMNKASTARHPSGWPPLRAGTAWRRSPWRGVARCRPRNSEARESGPPIR